MIASLVKETCELLQEIDDRERTKHDINSINETLSSLTALNEDVMHLQTSVQVSQSRLTPGEVAAAIEIGTRCAYKLKHSAEQFRVQPRQKTELQAIQSQIQKALDGLEKAWLAYTNERMREPNDLYILVAQLPEVAVHKSLYDSLLGKLRTAQNTMPVIEKQAQDFDMLIEQFNQMLHGIEGLSETIKTFLLKTLNGTASLEDVTDEVLHWCHQGQRGKTFSIRFAR